MKKIALIALTALMCVMFTMTSFAAALDLGTLGGVANYTPHGYEGVNGIMFGYNKAPINLGSYDLANYESIVVTYATDLGFQALKDGMPCAAFFAVLSEGGECVGWADTGIKNPEKILGQADCVDANAEFNPDGVNWGKGQRTAVIDVSDVDYNGPVLLSHYNSTGNEALVVGIELVEKEVTEPSNPPTADFGIMALVVSVVLGAAGAKKKIAE